MVYFTFTPQYIEGVEFAFMGQQGRLGRYPMHFHICRSHNSSYVRKLTVRNSMQRCVVRLLRDTRSSYWFLLLSDNEGVPSKGRRSEPRLSGHCSSC